MKNARKFSNIRDVFLYRAGQVTHGQGYRDAQRSGAGSSAPSASRVSAPIADSPIVRASSGELNGADRRRKSEDFRYEQVPASVIAFTPGAACSVIRPRTVSKENGGIAEKGRQRQGIRF